MGKLKIAKTRCGSCIFGPNSAIKGRPARMRQLQREWRAADAHQICHAFGVGETDDDGHEYLEGEDVVCRGFYDTQPPSQMMRIAERINCIEFVEQPK